MRSLCPSRPGRRPRQPATNGLARGPSQRGRARCAARQEVRPLWGFRGLAADSHAITESSRTPSQVLASRAPRDRPRPGSLGGNPKETGLPALARSLPRPPARFARGLPVTSPPTNARIPRRAWPVCAAFGSDPQPKDQPGAPKRAGGIPARPAGLWRLRPVRDVDGSLRKGGTQRKRDSRARRSSCHASRLESPGDSQLPRLRRMACSALYLACAGCSAAPAVWVSGPASEALDIGLGASRPPSGLAAVTLPFYRTDHREPGPGIGTVRRA